MRLEDDRDVPSPLPGDKLGANASSPDLLQASSSDKNLLTPPVNDTGASSDSGREDEKKDRQMFSAVEKPRTHYDVEVITKLVVYAGESILSRCQLLLTRLYRNCVACCGRQSDLI